MEEFDLPTDVAAGEATVEVRQAVETIARMRILGPPTTKWFVAGLFREAPAYGRRRLSRSRMRRPGESGEHADGRAFGGLERHRRVQQGFQLGVRPRADVGQRRRSSFCVLTDEGRTAYLRLTTPPAVGAPLRMQVTVWEAP